MSKTLELGRVVVEATATGAGTVGTPARIPAGGPARTEAMTRAYAGARKLAGHGLAAALGNSSRWSLKISYNRGGPP